MKGFRIISLSVSSHPILGTNEFIFYDQDDHDKDSPYFTIIIGPNGTGKSEILKCLLLIWRDFYQYFSATDSKFESLKFFYTLRYKLNGKKYTYSNGLTSKLVILSNKNRAFPKAKLLDSNSNEIPIINNKYYDYFPLQIVAQSIMMTDKFFVQRNEKEKLRFAPYHYLGIRNRPQQTSTGYYVRRTVDLIIKAIDNDYFQKGISNLIDFIGATGSFVVHYKTINYKLFYTGRLTAEILDEHFKEIEKKYKDKQAPYKLSDFKKLVKGKAIDLIKLVNFVNQLVNENRLTDIRNSSAKTLNFDLRNKDQMAFLKGHQYDIDWLRKLGLLTAPTIKFSDKDVELQSASSGEFHLFTTMIGLMASARANSLVIIDEPEISLHPNWQMKYLQFIRELFANTDRVTSHIIIATHSHFLISDLPGENSNIIGLKKIDGDIKSLEINKNTYGWSAEDVLYNVFEVSSTRNFYVAKEIGFILKEIANKNISHKNLKKKKEELQKIKTSLKDNDPLKSLITKIENEFIND